MGAHNLCDESTAMKWTSAISLFAAINVAHAAIYMPSFSNLKAGEWNYLVPGGDTGCAFGDAYGFLVRKGTTYPNKVMIEFEGGGSCYSWESCGQDDEAMQGTQVPYSVRMLGMTNQLADDLEDDDNLAFPGLISLGQEESGDGPVDGWTKIWVPHCTQDMHIGAATAVYEDEDAQDDNDDENDDGNKNNNKDDDEGEGEGEGEGEEDRTLTFNHNGLANAQSVIDYVAASISTSQVFMTGCGLTPFTAGHWAKEVNKQTGSGVTILSDSGIGMVPSNWVQKYFSNWGASCVVSKLFNDNNGGTYDLSSDDFWSTYSFESLWNILPSSNSNIKWLLYADVADEQNKEVYQEMQEQAREEENNNKGNKKEEGGYTIKAATLLSNVESAGNVKMWLVNSEKEDDEAEEEQQDDEEEQQDDEENDDDNNEKNQKSQKSQKSRKSRKEQDDAQCYQAGYNGLNLNADDDGEGEGEDDNNNKDNDGVTFSSWITTALTQPNNLQSQICQYCVPDYLEDCNGNEGGGQLPDACGTCPEQEEEENNDEDEDGDGEKNNKDDDDGEGEGEGEEEQYSCVFSQPSWFQSDTSNCMPSFQQTSGSRDSSSKSSSSGHMSMAVIGGVIILAAIAGFAIVNMNGKKGENRRLVDEEKGSAQTY